jgi:hypothetical protein
MGGPLFVAGFIASIAAGAALAKTSLFLPGASANELRDYYTHSGAAVVTAAVLQILAAGALLWFGRGVADTVGGGRRVKTMAWIAAGAFAASAVLSLVSMAMAATASDGTLHLVGRLTLALGGPAHLLGLGGLIWIASRAARESGRGPRWVWKFGTVVAPLMLLSLVSVAAPPLVRAEPLWRLLTAVWIITVSLRAKPVQAVVPDSGNGHARRRMSPATRT